MLSAVEKRSSILSGRARSFLTSIFFLVLFLSRATNAAAQGSGEFTIQAYPVIGVVSSQIEGDYLKGFKHWGFTAGVGAQMFLGSDRWSLSVEADFAQRGASEYNRNSRIPYLVEGLTLNYVDVPLLFHFKDPWGGIQLGLGFTYSRLVAQPHGKLSFSPTYVEPDTTDLSFLGNDLAICGDIRFAVWQGLMLDLRVNYSLIPVKRDWTFVEHVTANDVEPPIVTVNNCYNFSIALRLLYMLGPSPEPHRRR